MLIELQCFPPIHFFVEALIQKEVVLEAHENYRKGSYRNRYHIAGPNGLQRLSIPLSGGKHQQQPIQEVSISYEENWQNQHWRSISAAYGRAPFFIHYEDEIKAVLFNKSESLWTFNKTVLDCCTELLDLELDYRLSKEFLKIPSIEQNDRRNHFLPKNDEKQSKSTDSVHYPQVFQEKNGFLPNLSILDLIFCQGPQAGSRLQKAALNSTI